MEVLAADQGLTTVEGLWTLQYNHLDQNHVVSQPYGDSCVSFSLELDKVTNQRNQGTYSLTIAVASTTPIHFVHDVMVLRSTGNAASVMRSPVFIAFPVKKMMEDLEPFVDQTEVDNLRGPNYGQQWAVCIFATVKYCKHRTPYSVAACEIVARLQNSRMDEALTDCSLQVKQRKLDAHRCILSAHSDVFRAMFTHQDTSEYATGIIDIKDSSFEAVEAMLDYIYGGSVDKLGKCAVEVYKLADKYAIPHLKNRCYEALRAEVPQQEFCSLLELAHLMSSEELIKLCEDFVRSHQNFLKTAKWQEFRKKNPDAAFLLYDKIH